MHKNAISIKANPIHDPKTIRTHTGIKRMPQSTIFLSIPKKFWKLHYAKIILVMWCNAPHSAAQTPHSPLGTHPPTALSTPAALAGDPCMRPTFCDDL